jgi:hypothetical protein
VSTTRCVQSTVSLFLFSFFFSILKINVIMVFKTSSDPSERERNGVVVVVVSRCVQSIVSLFLFSFFFSQF